MSSTSSRARPVRTSSSSTRSARGIPTPYRPPLPVEYAMRVPSGDSDAIRACKHPPGRSVATNSTPAQPGVTSSARTPSPVATIAVSRSAGLVDSTPPGQRATTAPSASRATTVSAVGTRGYVYASGGAVGP